MNIKHYILEFQNLIPLIFLRLFKKELLIVVNPKNIIFSLNILKNHINYKYNLLSCISGIDLLNKKYRFCISYDILSVFFNCRIRLKTFLDEVTPINSVISIYINSNWWEREIWDLFGIFFENHNDLRRILTDYGFEGHPMRKDFPLFGYIELRYNENKKRIVSDRVQLTQEFRTFSFETPW
jgi:NADH dehydrogenase (ubiquinone) Fe-S protein 3